MTVAFWCGVSAAIIFGTIVAAVATWVLRREIDDIKDR